MRYIEKLNDLPQIEIAEKEADGIAVYTANGYCWVEDGCHTRFFDTAAEAWEDRDLIRDCSGSQKCCIPLLTPIPPNGP